MESPFVNLPEIDALSSDIHFVPDIEPESPFVDAEWDDENAPDPDHMEEDLVDEEEAGYDFHDHEDDEDAYSHEVDAEEEALADELDESPPEEQFLPGLAILSGKLPVEPLPVPEKDPVPFAPLPAAFSYWPVITRNKRGREVAFLSTDKKPTGNAGRRFLAPRSGGTRYHAGIDLFGNHRDPVVACEDGTIVNFYHFYRGTYALLVEHSSVVINYGEVEKDSLSANRLKIHDRVKAGQVIAFVGKMYSSSMLHVEAYVKGTRSNKQFKPGGPRPKELLNPTRYLLFLKNYGLASGTSPGAATTREIAAAESPPSQPRPVSRLPRTDDPVVAKISGFHDIIERLSKVQFSPARAAINPNVVRGIIAAESGGNPDSGKGKPGYKGLMQAYHDDSSFAHRKDYHGNQLDPATSIRSGIEKFLYFQQKILNPWLQRKLGLSLTSIDRENYLKMSLACYNAGPVTALKAIQYAHQSGDWRQWLSDQHYLRALAFSGGYSYYNKCSRGLDKPQVHQAKADRLKYRFKTKGWRTEKDPPSWNELTKLLNPITRCWIETKYRNTPGYLDRFIQYYKYFEQHQTVRETETDEFTREPDEQRFDEAENQFQQHDEYQQDEYQQEDYGNSHPEPVYETDESEHTMDEALTWESVEGEEEFNALTAGEDEAFEAETDLEDFHSDEREDESAYADLEEYTSDDPDWSRETDVETTGPDMEEWEEDQLESSRSGIADVVGVQEWEIESETAPAVSAAVFGNWLNSVRHMKPWLPAEPENNLDQLPIPSWITPQTFYNQFAGRHGEEAKTIMGDISRKVKAKYFVLHDTAVAADFSKTQVKGKGIHLWVNARNPAVLANDWHVKGLGVKLERKRNDAFVHVEITRDKDLERKVKAKTKGRKVSYEDIATTGLRNFGTYYTDKQYELTAYAYLVASMRKGSFLTVTIHREVDRSVVVKRAGGSYGYGHDDPQFFDIDYFYSIVSRILSIPAKVTFGIQMERVMAFRQSNMAGYVNSFIPFVTGDSAAANQYGAIQRLDPKGSPYKVIKLKHGYYYNVSALKNNHRQNETDGELLEDETPKAYGPGTTVPPLIAEDRSLPGYTCYIRIDIGKGNYPLTMTGIYIPRNFDPAKPVDAVFYLHGMTGTFPGACSQMIDYWSAADLPKFDLRIREDVDAANKNVVLIAPSLGDNPNKYRYTFSSVPGGFDQYMGAALAALNKYVIQDRLRSAPIDFRNVVLAAHSAGGLPMLRTALAKNPVYGPKIAECWGFDSLYGKVAGTWNDWARRNSGKKLIVYYQSSTEGNSKALVQSSRTLSNVFVKRSPAKNHFWVVRHHLKERVMRIGDPTITKSAF